MSIHSWLLGKKNSTNGCYIRQSSLHALATDHFERKWIIDKQRERAVSRCFYLANVFGYF